MVSKWAWERGWVESPRFEGRFMFLHRCKIKSGSGLGTRLDCMYLSHLAAISHILGSHCYKHKLILTCSLQVVHVWGKQFFVYGIAAWRTPKKICKFYLALIRGHTITRGRGSVSPAHFHVLLLIQMMVFVLQLFLSSFIYTHIFPSLLIIAEPGVHKNRWLK